MVITRLRLGHCTESGWQWLASTQMENASVHRQKLYHTLMDHTQRERGLMQAELSRNGVRSFIEINTRSGTLWNMSFPPLHWILCKDLIHSVEFCKWAVEDSNTLLLCPVCPEFIKRRRPPRVQSEVQIGSRCVVQSWGPVTVTFFFFVYTVYLLGCKSENIVFKAAVE